MMRCVVGLGEGACRSAIYSSETGFDMAGMTGGVGVFATTSDLSSTRRDQISGEPRLKATLRMYSASSLEGGGNSGKGFVSDLSSMSTDCGFIATAKSASKQRRAIQREAS